MLQQLTLELDYNMSCDRIVNNFVQGDTPTWGTAVYTDSTEETIVDTTGWKCWVTLKTDLDDTDANADMQVSGIMTSANGALGLLFCSPDKETSSALADGSYYYDFQIATADGVIDTPEDGKVKVRQTATLTNV